MKTNDNPGRRAFIPPWMTDKDMVAPCPCGDPPEPPMIVATSQYGLHRAWHVRCWQMFMSGAEIEEDDE